MKSSYFLLLIALLVPVFSQINRLRVNRVLPKFDVIIVGTNDIHGTAYPIVLSRKDTGEKYNLGGLVYMARLIEILKKKNDGNVLYLDAGDQFQGGLEASKAVSQGQIISDYFNHVMNDGSAVGNHQFDFGPDFLNNYLQKSQQSILSANLADSQTQKLPLTKQQKSQIYKFQIKDRNPLIDSELTQIKIGVIGLSTVQSLYTTSGFTDGMFPKTYKFEQYRKIVIEQSSKLKSQGVHAVIIVSHVGNECTKTAQHGFWTIKTQPKTIPCNMQDQIFKLIDDIPAGTIDAVVQGHRHTQSHYFYKGIPIIGSVNGGFYFNTIRLRFTLNGKKAYINPDDLQIQGPIPVCQKIFEGTRKCEYVPEKDLKKAGQLRQWYYYGQKVYADPDLSQIYRQKYEEKMKPYKHQIASNYIEYPIARNFSMNSALGNLITNIIANSIKRRNDLNLDFVILNVGGFRSTWYPGVIRYAQLYSMFPFGKDELVSFRVSGKGLKRMLQIIQNGAKGFYASWGLQQKFVNVSDDSRKNLVTEKASEKKSKLVLKQLKSTVTQQAIEDNKIYTGVTLAFLVNGGDDFAQVVNRPDEIKLYDKNVYPIMMRNLIQMELEEMKNINEKDILGPNKLERIIIDEPKTISN